MPPVALIAGPTASGKSALAVALAERTNGVVINADSAQLYRQIPILSAAPTELQRSRADHLLYGICDASEPCSAADWARIARIAISDAHSGGRLPILVGGSGLYLRTLLDGIAPVPAIDPEIRDQVRSRPVEDNRFELMALDPQAASRLDAGDSSRIARALEVILSTGRTLASWQTGREGGIAGTITLDPLILLPPRQWLHARCNDRFEAMIDMGAIDEVKALLALRLDPGLPAMRAIGVSEIAAFVRGEMTLDEAIMSGRQSTRNYAKRQYTWFTRQPPPQWPRFADALDRTTTEEALALLKPSD